MERLKFGLVFRVLADLSVFGVGLHESIEALLNESWVERDDAVHRYLISIQFYYLKSGARPPFEDLDFGTWGDAVIRGTDLALVTGAWGLVWGSFSDLLLDLPPGRSDQEKRSQLLEFGLDSEDVGLILGGLAPVSIRTPSRAPLDLRYCEALLREAAQRIGESEVRVGSVLMGWRV